MPRHSGWGDVLMGIVIVLILIGVFLAGYYAGKEIGHREERRVEAVTGGER